MSCKSNQSTEPIETRYTEQDSLLFKQLIEIHANSEMLPKTKIAKVDSINNIFEIRKLNRYRLKAYTVLSNIYIKTQDTLELKRVINEAKQIAETSEDSVVIATYYALDGYHKLFTDKRKQAYQQYTKAMNYAKGKDIPTYQNCLNRMTFFSIEMNDYDTALKLQKECLEIDRSSMDYFTAESYLNVAKIYYYLEDPTNMANYIDSAAVVMREKNIPEFVLYNQIKGNYHYLKNEYKDAIKYYNKDIQLYQATGWEIDYQPRIDKIKVFDVMNLRDSIKTELNYLKPQEYQIFDDRDVAIQYFPYKIKYSNGEESTSAKNEYIKLLEKISTENNGLSNIKINYKIEQADQQRQYELNIEKEKRNKFAIASVSLLAALISLSLLFYFWYQKNRLKAKNEKLKNETIKKRIKVIADERSRIAQELHDDLGANFTLINLSSNLLKEKYPDVHYRELDIIMENNGKIYDKLKEIVWSLNTQNDTLGNFMLYTKEFAQNFLAETNITLEFEDFTEPYHDTFMNALVRRRLYLIVKELINNSVKHADASKISIQFHYLKDTLNIRYQDNGIGFTEETITKGNGLDNIQKHIEIIGNSHFDFHTNAQGTSYNLKAKIIKNHD